MSVNKKCSRECIAYIMSYASVMRDINIAESELTDARREFNDTRMAMLKDKIAGLESTAAEIEYTADNYTPLDVRPYRGNTFWLERSYLRCRFIVGASVERTAELMKISVSTAYRLGRYMMKVIEPE